MPVRCGTVRGMNWGRLLDLLYPRACAGCGGALADDARHVCWDCRAALRVIGSPHCSWCGNPLEGRSDHAYVCYHCTQMQPAFDLARSAVRFEGVAADLIHRFKYGDALWLQDDLAELLEACVAVHYAGHPVDAVCCVPLYHARERHRGYNQARLLAGHLSRSLGKPLWPRVLARGRPTETQTHLTARDRLSNVKGAFRVRQPARVRGRRLLLVDDVMTTGATTSECARALKEAGVAAVYVVTLARGS